jgi:cation diffusion facilitator CzcD-associated flavoprotein CzcO
MSSYKSNEQVSSNNRTEFDVIVIGAGYAGLYMLYKLRKLGLTVRVIEAADDVGGTWYWNRYPGARCDSESYYYSYTFSKELLQEWSWSERYAAQPEILQYLQHVASRFDLRRDILFNTRVISSAFDEDKDKWEINTDKGIHFSARFFINAVGCLSAANIPNIEGLDQFEGEWFHTGKWPHEKVDFKGKKVGVIGTGATGIQCIPEIAKEAEHLTVFQRTPNFASPANNRPISKEDDQQIKANYEKLIEKMRYAHAGFPYETRGKHAMEVSEQERNQIYEELWEKGSLHFLYSFSDLLFNKEANHTAAEFIRSKIREIVHDPQVAELLCPKGYYYGAKRPALNWNYYETFNRDNVSLVDIKRSPIVKITSKGILTKEKEYELDNIVFATGFDALTGSLVKIDIKGRNGVSLNEKWKDGPCTYLGLGVHGFPNMFIVGGPGGPSVLVNYPIMVEQAVDWITDIIQFTLKNNFNRFEPTVEAENAWGDTVNDEANKTLYGVTNSWYSGVNIEGKPKVFMPFVGGLKKYRKFCDDDAARGYEGFVFDKKFSTN